MYDNSVGDMPVLTFRLDDDVAQRFAALASASGGRSALLRRLIGDALAMEAGEGRRVPRARRRATCRVEVRLIPEEIAALDREADALGMKRTDWITTLLARRLRANAPLPREERAAVAQAWRELNRIGINLNQATRALNASVMVESGLDVVREAARVASFRAEIVDALAGLGAALKGDLRYWDTADA
jgi:hypothetical protein